MNPNVYSAESLASALHAAKIDCNPLLPMESPLYQLLPEKYGHYPSMHMQLHAESARVILSTDYGIWTTEELLFAFLSLDKWKRTRLMTWDEWTAEILRYHRGI